MSVWCVVCGKTDLDCHVSDNGKLLYCFNPEQSNGLAKNAEGGFTHRVRHCGCGEKHEVREEATVEPGPAPAVVSAAWPDPPAAEAYHGLAGEIARAIEPHTEADPIALLVQFLVCYGNAIGRHSYFAVEASRHYCNLFSVLVGPTGKGRKGTSWDHVRRLFETVDPDWTKTRITSGLSSGEGLKWAVRDPNEDAEDDGVQDKRLLVYETEYASVLRVLRRDGNTLSAVVRGAWDSGDLGTLTKNDPARATGAHVSIVGHVTKDELLRHLDATEAGNGFGNRFLWLCVKRSKLLPEGGRIHEVNFTPLLDRLRSAVAFGRATRELQRDDGARSLWREAYPSLSEGKPGLLGSMIGRGDAQVVRLSSAYALLDQYPKIQEKHLKAALALWDYCERSARYVFGDSLGDPDADEILRALRASGGMSRTAIRDLFGRNRNAQQIMRALTRLAELNLIRAEIRETEGRPAEFWLPVDHSTTKTTETTKVPPSVVNVVSVVDADPYERLERAAIQGEGKDV